MAVTIAQFTKLLKKHINSKFPELQVEFYVRKRKQYIHMGIDRPLFVFFNNDQIMDELKNFKVNNFDLSKYKTVFPTLIVTTRWKYDYIIYRRKQTLKQK